MSVTSQASDAGPAVIENAICVFEMPLGGSLYRALLWGSHLSPADAVGA